MRHNTGLIYAFSIHFRRTDGNASIYGGRYRSISGIVTMTSTQLLCARAHDWDVGAQVTSTFRAHYNGPNYQNTSTRTVTGPNK